jgi:hypothetical protein
MGSTFHMLRQWRTTSGKSAPLVLPLERTEGARNVVAAGALSTINFLCDCRDTLRCAAKPMERTL